LDPARDDPNFVYATAYTDITGELFSGSFQGEKHVSIDGIKWENGITKNVTVYEGSTYTYRVSVVVEKGKSASNIIFYDPFETAEPQDPRTLGYDTKGSWQGLFQSIDVSPLRELGAAPVIYYYTGSDPLPIEKNMLSVDLNYHGEGWSTDLPADPTTVKAVVVDVSLDVNGDPFVLEGKKIVTLADGSTQEVEEEVRASIYLYMRAPVGEEPFENSADRYDPNENAHAFNSSFLYASVSDGSLSIGISEWNQTSLAKVGIVPYEVLVEKTWSDYDDNDGIRPESITVDLYANDGEEPVATAEVTPDESGNWVGGFYHVRRYDDDGAPISYTVKEREIEGYTSTVTFVSSDDSGMRFKIENSHEREKTSIPFTKIWDIPEGENDDLDRPNAVIVELYRWVETTTVDEETGEETTTGEWKYTGSMKYLRATAGGDGFTWSGSFDNLLKYENHGTEIIYTVREQRVDSYITSYEEYTPGDTDDSLKNTPVIRNRYYPYGDLLVSKTVENATAAALEKGEFSFVLIVKYKDTEVSDFFDYVKTHADGTTEEGKLLGVSEFTLKSGETILIKNIHARSTYELIETPSQGFTLKSSSGATGRIVAGETSKASFLNRYESTASVYFTATKQLTGRRLANRQFTFLLRDQNWEEIGTTQNAASTDSTVAGGSAPISFPTLSYTDADDGATYYYAISEVKPEDAPEYYVYDGKIYGVAVTLTDNGDGTLKSEVKYLGEVSEGADLAAIAATV
ncbi:MAG: Cna B-type domain-containing protein, partial [Oscillospiraceae bacterium]|nr:Cna B-type domain-containing protein [Oscillospiraceae bacterium]